MIERTGSPWPSDARFQYQNPGTPGKRRASWTFGDQLLLHNSFYISTFKLSPQGPANCKKYYSWR